MIKPITIGVIDVIATILVTSAVDFSAVEAKPVNQIFLQGESRDNGEIICPDGQTMETSMIFSSFSFRELEIGGEGNYNLATQDQSSQRRINGGMVSGEVTNNSYQIRATASINQPLQEVCGLSGTDFTAMTIFGQCGENVAINFEADNGYKGSTVGKVVCI